MLSKNRSLLAFTLLTALGIALTARYLFAQSPASPAALDASFEHDIKPFFQKNCMSCHNSETGTAGVRVDQLDSKLEDRHLPTWEAIQRRVRNGTMPPKGLPQPSVAEREKINEWIGSALEMARMRPAPKNGLVRRLTVAQYRNTLHELLQLEDDLTGGLPPDAISKDGFVNNKDTLQLSPLLTESYFDIAELALNRAIVDPSVKPSIQNFRVDLGEAINPAPLPEKLVLGADSMLLENPDFLVTQVTPVKPFAFEPHPMRTKYRYIEGYRGNDTVRGWRDYDSIYHAVFADMRGSRGYPKGDPYNLVKEGLLLRPAIPNDEIFGADGTYGPKANFKISLRELPDDGRFRVTVMAAKYNDGLLLDPGTGSLAGSGSTVWKVTKAPGTVGIPKAGAYQVEIVESDQTIPAPDSSRLGVGLTGNWPADQKAKGKVNGEAKLVESPLGQAVALNGANGGYTVARAQLPTNDPQLVGEGDFSVSAWIHTGAAPLRRSGFVSLGGMDRLQGWYLETSDNRGTLRFLTAGQDVDANASVLSPPGVIKPNAWQHVAVVVRRGFNETRMYVNGYLVARANTGTAQYDAERSDLQLGRIPGAAPFQGDLADVRLYNRPLEDAEIQALVQPGKQFVTGNPLPKRDITLRLGDRKFSGKLEQSAFLAVRLDAGPLPVKLQFSGFGEPERLLFVPLPTGSDVSKRFLAFEKRLPKLSVLLGLRRDCGSTLAPVGPPQIVGSEKLSRYVFEGAIRNFPSPSVEKDNVNYLAGVREIGVHSEYTDGRDMPRMLIRSVEFEGPFYESWPPASHRNIFVDFERKSDSTAYARKIIHDFASRAYRRPVTPGEESALLTVYQNATKNGRSFPDSIKDALLVVLTSPQFLFLLENSNTPDAEAVDCYELASKLSYFLWNGPPDRKTLQLAANGTLRAQLSAEVNRMIAAPAFSRFMGEFVSQWLSLDKFQVLEPDHKRYPKLTRDMRAQLRQEPVEFLQYLIRANLPLKNLIESDFIVANETVASYYGLADKTESGFQFVPIVHGRPELGGVLTEAAIMAGLSDGRESNPVKRGAWLARKIIAEPPADPPPNVPVLKEDTTGLTLRQRIEMHRNQNGCRQCHAKIDPWGVAFEGYDAGGLLKHGAVDAKSTLPDKTEVNGANDLKKYLGEDRIDQVAFSFLKHLTVYATGRTLTYNELAFLKQDGLKLKPNGYRMQDMVQYVVNSKMFLEK
jgi:mono/diheme cytochrome c family protein